MANTFVKALTTFRNGNIQAWMYKVLRNEYLDMQKKKKYEADSNERLLDIIPASDDTYNTCLKSEQLKWVYRQIGMLPGLEREVMLLTLQTDYKDHQIAEILGISVSNVRVIRHRSKAKILKASEEENI